MSIDPFDELANLEPASTKTVPNLFPSITNTPYKIAIIGEAPGQDELDSGIPFFGASGRLLNQALDRARILRDACFVGNICQHKPFKNRIASFAWTGPEIQSGLTSLTHDLNNLPFRPNLLWLLGGTALHVFKSGLSDIPNVRKTKEGPVFAYRNSVSDWRGSLFLSHPNSPLPDVKCVASYHPAFCLRNYELTPQFFLDSLCKVKTESLSPTLTLPERRLLVKLSFDELIAELRKIQTEKPLVSVDIEGTVGAMSCLSLATSPSFSFIVPFTTSNGNSFWHHDEEYFIWRELAKVLCSPDIPKVLQNSLYDRFVLQYSYGIVVRNVVDDTMLKHWELYPELEKSLGFQCSIYTNEPFYKSERKSDTQEAFHRYCCKDSAVTFEINEKLSKWVKDRALTHYQFNMDILNPLLYMEMRGIRYDTALAKSRLLVVEDQLNTLQYQLDTLSGFGVTTSDKVVLRALVRETMCQKKDSSKVYATYLGIHDPIMRILQGDHPLTPAQLGKISIALKLSLNIRSPEFKTYLYSTLSLPKQYDKKDKEKDKKDRSLTADAEALLILTSLPDLTPKQKTTVDLAYSIAELRTRAQMLRIFADGDGRIRCGYNAVGTETNRITCYKSPTGSGYNLQTVPDVNPLRAPSHPLHAGMRDLFIADAGHYLFQCDLSGADGWDVGANLYQLGEPAMLEDLRAKIKPAQRLAYMLRHGNDSLKGKSREEIKVLLKEVKKEDFDYFMCKVGIWGICYLMGVDLLSDIIFKESEGKIIMSRSDVETFRKAVYSAYRPEVWHRKVESNLKKQPYPAKMTCPSGHTRTFFGRYNEILGEALANEPQDTTTYATKLALYNLWSDPENRTPDGRKLRIEPLHTVHDSLLGQFRVEDVSWAKTKINQYFNNTIIIAGLPLVIPFSGTYGTSWAMDEVTKIGDL